MRPTSVKPMVEAGIMASVSILFALISAYVPLLGVLVNLIWPVPIVLLGVRHGLKWSVMATAVAGVLIAILVQPLHAITMVLGLGLIGIVLGYAFRRKMSPAATILWGSVASLVSKAAILGLGMVTLGVNPLAAMPEAMEKAVSQALDIYRGLGAPEQVLEQMQTQLQPMVKLLPVVIPASLLLAAVVDTFLNFLIAKTVLRKLGQPVAGFAPFKDWVLPRWILYFYALAILMIYHGSKEQMELLYKAGMNLQILSTALLLLQGLSVFYFLADKYNLSRIQRGIILMMTFVIPVVSSIAVFAGAFELVLDYRKLRTVRSQ
ncbi:MAG TPA: YybS family protein [Selenomonadales bacterium]|nr:YybS family protein [Selenomonadales bacterium]